MEHALFALPIQAGKTDAAREFLQQLEGERKGQYATSEQRLGITKEVWALQQSPMGDLFVVFFQSPNIGSSLSQFVASQDEFDQWVQAAGERDRGRGSQCAATRPFERDSVRIRGLSSS